MQPLVYGIGFAVIALLFMVVRNSNKIHKLKKNRGRGGRGGGIFDDASKTESSVILTPAGIIVPKRAFLVQIKVNDDSTSAPTYSVGNGDGETQDETAELVTVAGYDAEKLRDALNARDARYVFRADRRTLHQIVDMTTGSVASGTVDTDVIFAVKPAPDGTSLVTESEIRDGVGPIVTIMTLPLYSAGDIPAP